MTLPADFVATKEDSEFASDLLALNALVALCNRDGQVGILLSTCRNAYLTINALFVDLREALGRPDEMLSLGAAVDGLLRYPSSDLDRISQSATRSLNACAAFEEKRRVWHRRDELWVELDGAKSAMRARDILAADRAERYLNNAHVHLVGRDGEDGWDRSLLTMDRREEPHLELEFEALDATFEIVKGAARLALHAAEYLSRSPRQGFLSLGTGPVDGASDAKVHEWARRLATNCEWPFIQSADGALTIKLAGEYQRPANLQPLHSVAILPIVEESVASYGQLVREATYLAHHMLKRKFRPNVGRMPLPPPFEIELRAPVPLEVGSPDIPTISVVRCSRRGHADNARIALAGLVLPYEKLQSFAIPEESASAVMKDVELAIRVAVDQKCQAIVFPEYSIPRLQRPRLEVLSKEHDIIIVGGLEGMFAGEGLLHDEAIVAIPGNGSVLQVKQRPSLEEQTEHSYYADGVFHLFRNSAIGDFVVVVCSDLLQLPTVQMWAGRAELPELVLVVARNRPKHVDLFTTLAKADALRLYAAIAICNVADPDERTGAATAFGSAVLVPTVGDQLLEGSEAQVVGGHYIESLTVFDVPMHALRAASRGKPEPGFLAVPVAARRG